MIKTMIFEAKKPLTLFCLAVCTKNTGSTKISSELELFKLVHKKPASFLAYDEQAVCCAVEEDLDVFPIQKVAAIENDF